MTCFNVTLAELTLSGEAETLALGARLEQHLNFGDVIGLEGEMGAGKSVLARGVIRAAATRTGIAVEDIPSPTFTLVQYYPRAPHHANSGRANSGRANSGRAEDHLIWHIDLWRLDTPQDAFDIGLDEAMANAVCLIEWMSKLGPSAPQDALQMTLKQGKTPDERQVSFHAAAAHQDHWRRILEAANVPITPEPTPTQ
jgi:tRNA threonylcarbamoyladenosine biosynthesis protein TsaE